MWLNLMYIFRIWVSFFLILAFQFLIKMFNLLWYGLYKCYRCDLPLSFLPPASPLSFWSCLEVYKIWNFDFCEHFGFVSGPALFIPYMVFSASSSLLCASFDNFSLVLSNHLHPCITTHRAWKCCHTLWPCVSALGSCSFNNQST